MADAVALFEGLAQELREHKREFRDHKTEFKEHVKEQGAFNTAITARVVETEKVSIEINLKLDTIIKNQEKRRVGWQIWLPFSVTAAFSLASFLYLVFSSKPTP